MRIAFSLLIAAALGAQTPVPEPTTEVAYRTVSGDELKLHIFNPAGHSPAAKRPAMVFFFGGGWKNGSWTQFRQQCAHLASRGMVAIAADYRIESKHKSTAFDSVADARDAVRWIRANSSTLGIDPERIAAGGGSAGGHLAAAVAVLGTKEEKPNALVLFNPVLDMTIVKALGDRAKEISPIHNLKKAGPPTIVFHGTADKTVPFEQAERFCGEMKRLGSRCEVSPAEGEAHGFFNYGRNGSIWYDKTLAQADAFLTSLGYLPAK